VRGHEVEIMSENNQKYVSRRGVLSAAAVIGLAGSGATAGVADAAVSARWRRRPRSTEPRPSTRPIKSPTPTPTPTPSPTPVAGAALIGMSAPATVWDQRVREVGSGLAARRIFADLAGGASSQMKLVQQAHQAGLLPVISYKVGGDAAGAASGKFNAVAEQAAAQLASYNLPTAVTFWHEPHGDLTPAQYVAASKQLLPIFKRGQLRVGPILNGWLLDNQQSTFASYCPDEMFRIWDWFGIDTYESGTMESPGARKPAERIPAMAKHLSSRGFNLPMAVGEYNGYSAQTIAAAGEMLLSTPNIWFGCVWNSSGGKGLPLEGERLTAFQNTLADPRSAPARSDAA
jgi:hypothetical protein